MARATSFASTAAIVLTFAASLALAQKLPGVPIALPDAFAREALPLMSGANYLGLGAEAARVASWMRGHTAPFTLRFEERRLEDKTATSLDVSPAIAQTMSRLAQWYGLAATNENPITHAQLEAAALDPAAVSRIRAIFDDAVARGVRVGVKWMTPEAGGESTIDADLHLVEARDPRWVTVQALARTSSDALAVASLYATRSADVAPLDEHALIRLSLERLKLGSPGAAKEVLRAVLTVVENAASTYAHDPGEQFALIASHDWKGRYVGRWHTHPPHDGGGAWLGGEVPSFEDMQNAVAAGQYLTLAFQPDGFDLYDASALADEGRMDLGLMKIVRYRSIAWRDHFEQLRRRLGARPAPPRG